MSGSGGLFCGEGRRARTGSGTIGIGRGAAGGRASSSGRRSRVHTYNTISNMYLERTAAGGARVDRSKVSRFHYLRNVGMSYYVRGLGR